MTGAEREDFRELRAEMREGFKEVRAVLTVLAGRVHSLELSREREAGRAEAGEEIDRKAVSTAQVQRTAAIFENVKLNRSNLQVAALLGIVAALPNILTLVIGLLSG